MGATMGKNGTLLDSLPSTQGTMHIVMLGLDSAGKTTALYRLKFDQYLNTVPTIGFNCEKVRGQVGRAKGAQFLVWDVGGQEKLRPLWRSYTRCTDGIVFVLDSVDIERMEEAKMELMRTAKCPDNQGVPVLILANKQDLPGAREPKQLEKLLGLHELSPIITISSSSSTSTNPTQTFKGWYIQPACAITGEGLHEGLEALYDMIVKKRKISKANKKKR
ncbi:ADP-ribosylation factor-like protein 4C [Bradysia coprophila]|uniref:ADP-ribosylation factor-like protein 4C n=1 Tax=Bradysia coprophila TaxID=38358 RepID=UPI00187DC131|nr:ADP-ribosylation factor-like protein 4C [Bradysia coprophila]